MIVSVGFTAPIEGKKLASVMYRLSSSCALQWRSSTELAGSVPNRQVPAWCAVPPIGMSLPRYRRRSIRCGHAPNGVSNPSSLARRRFAASSLPVSYTHLDVYKRQVLVEAEAVGKAGRDLVKDPAR